MKGLRNQCEGKVGEVISDIGANAVSAGCGVECAWGIKTGSEWSSKYCSEIEVGL